MGVQGPTIKRFRGDGLSLRLQSNEQVLEVTGDGCSVTMTKNCGRIRIVGDGCRLRIDHNTGDVEYTGDGGQVLLGPKSSRDKVKYVGDGGRVTYGPESRSPDVQNRRISKDKVSEARRTNVKGLLTSLEETENTLNAKRQALSSNPGGKDVRRGENLVKIVTTFRCDEKIVNRWFANPDSVVRSFDGASFVKVIPKRTKTKI